LVKTDNNYTSGFGNVAYIIGSLVIGPIISVFYKTLCHYVKAKKNLEIRQLKFGFYLRKSRETLPSISKGFL
jgi:hypothetical protein